MALAVFSLLSIVDYANPNECPENARYILSAISQGLAAILALVFTITLVVSQMTRRYTAMDKIIFRRGTIFLMLVFGTGIILPLFALKFGWFCVGINSSIALAGFCVFSLLPFLKDINSVLKYDIGIANLDEEIMEAIELGYEPKAKNKIMELNKIGKDAVGEFRKDAVRNILNPLSGIGKKSAGKRFEDATSLVVRGLREIGIGSIKDDMFPEIDEITEITEIAVMGLKDIGVEAAKNRSEELSGVVQEAIDGLKDIGTKAAENRFVRTTINAVRGLKDVFMELRDSTELIDKKDKLTVLINKHGKYNAVNGVWCLGAFVTEYIPERVDFVIQNLKEIEYLFSWDNVPGTDSERLLRFLRDDLDIGWAENAEISKSDDGKTIRIYKDENSAEMMIDEKKEKATLEISDGKTHNLKVKKEDEKLNIYEVMKYEKGCIKDYIKDYPNLKSALEKFKKRYNEG